MFCLPFANRASDSGDLYIDFDRNQLLLLVALLVFQVEARFNLSFPKHAYASHITSRISCYVLYHVVCALHVVDCVSLCLLFLLWVEPGVEYVIKDPVEYAYEDQTNVNSETLQAR